MAKIPKKIIIPAKVVLEQVADNLVLPDRATYDLKTFAGSMQLFAYQEDAVIKATKLLCRYFNSDETNFGVEFLEDVYRRATDYPLDNLTVVDSKDKNSLYPLLVDYFSSDNDKLKYTQFLNRMNFWMATGSGKTIVMVKLISIVVRLMQDKIIPHKPIMILAPDENILSQIIKVVDKYNVYSSHKLNLVDLKQNWERDNQFSQPDFFSGDATKVYYYKSNNFVADKSKVASGKDGKDIYFDNYRNSDGWYLFLDEAHRGEDSTSKRKAIFNILVKNGFLFNFSATFTDDIDILTTVFDMNLAKFLQAGYGKKLYISETEIGNLVHSNNQTLLVDNEDIEKQKTIAKTVLLLALQRKNASLIKSINNDLYHMPLMLILAGQVNSEDKGLKPFFNYLIHMVKNEWDITHAKNELKSELKAVKDGNYANFKFGLGDELQISTMCEQIDELTTVDIWKHVFGGEKSNIEIITFDKNKNEVAFKLKTADQPFALLVIGDAINWLKHDTSGVFEVVNRSLDASLFDAINTSNNISMLLGSQMFKEGWDSNRPNIVCYLGIGKNADNKKYVMQTIGRGIRVEPLPNQRKRFEYCCSDILSIDEVQQIKELAPILETEFVFATDSKAINEIWSIIQEQGSKVDWNDDISKFFKVNKNLSQEILIPRYKDSETLNDNPFRTSGANKQSLQNYITDKSDKILALQHNLNLRTIKKLRDTENNIKASNQTNISLYKPEYLVGLLHTHFNKRDKVIAEYVHLSNQINHYNHIATTLTNGELEQLEKELKHIMLDDSKVINEEVLLDQLLAQQISAEEYAEKLRNTKQHNSQIGGYKIIKVVNGIKKLFQQHYYQPLILVEEIYHDKFKHIVKVSSEVDFLSKLCDYQDNLNTKYEWWYFTKVDETLYIEIGIEYFDQTVGKSRKFYPDFIFWLKEKTTGKLLIKFIDPKGGEHQNNPYDKVIGFEKIFKLAGNSIIHTENQTNGEQCQIDLYFYNTDELVARALGDEYKKYWCSSLGQIF